jgi:accessory gene regulator B
MISLLSKSIAIFLLKKEIITSEDIEICEYGFELMIATVIGLGLVLLSGLIMGEFILSVVFYVVFVIVRFFTGGYHANTHLKCKLTLILCCNFVLIMTKLLICTSNVYTIIALHSVYLFAVLVFSPVENANAPIEADLKRRNRKISIIMAITITFTGIIGYYYFMKIIVSESLTVFVIAYLIIIAKLKGRRIKDNEKSSKESFES